MSNSNRLVIVMINSKSNGDTIIDAIRFYTRLINSDTVVDNEK